MFNFLFVINEILIFRIFKVQTDVAFGMSASHNRGNEIPKKLLRKIYVISGSFNS